MTGNIFEFETTALAHRAGATHDSGILLTDFFLCLPKRDHSWIFRVLEAELPGFLRHFLRMIYNNRVTNVEFAAKTRGQFLMARGVRQGCPASGFLFTIVFDPFFSVASRFGYSKRPCVA